MSHFLSDYRFTENKHRKGWGTYYCNKCKWHNVGGYWQGLGKFTDHAIEKHNPDALHSKVK